MDADVGLDTGSPLNPEPSGDPLASDLRRGLALVPRAWRLLRRERSLWVPAAIPVLITTASVSLAVALAYGSAGVWLAAVQAELPWPGANAWYSWIWVGPVRLGIWLAARLLVGVLAAACVVVGLLLASLISSPILDVLSQRVERVVRGVAVGDDEALGARTLLADAGASVLNEARRLAFFGGGWLLITAVGFAIPFGPLLAPAALAAFAAAFLPLEYAGFALDRRRIGFPGRRAWLAEQRTSALAFGALAFAMTWVPGLNFLLLPLLVTAGTLLVLDRPPELDAGA
jgi:CysZ protein